MTQKQILLAIENERERRGMDTRELARRAGVAEGTISLWMKSDTSPSLGKLLRVAEALDMTILCCYREPEKNRRKRWEETKLTKETTPEGVLGSRKYKCGYCGNIIIDTFKWCPYCGRGVPHK